jgi:hypothetical protein
MEPRPTGAAWSAESKEAAQALDQGRILRNMLRKGAVMLSIETGTARSSPGIGRMGGPMSRARSTTSLNIPIDRVF